MRKGGELWDDSPLLKAFDAAISKYKVIHGVSESAEAKTATNSSPADNRNECVQDDNNIDPTLVNSGRIGETANTSQVLENPKSELGSSAEHVASSNTQNGSLPPNNASAATQSGPSEKHTVSSYVKSQNEFIWNSNDQEEHNQLWNKYYEIEEQRQKILQQLNQYSNWNYQTYPYEEHQGSVPQPYDTVTCYCQYGCQNLAFPCNSVPDSCLGGNCTDKDCTVVSKGVHGGTSLSEEDPDIVKTTMDAAQRVLFSLKKENFSRADTSANGGKNKELGGERDHVTDSTNSATDLSEVLNAWYSAGFYTGKYLSEESFEKKKHG